MEAVKSNLPLYNYTDYREFLRDYIQEKNNASRSWSLTVWHRQLGLSSSATLSMIVNGKRNPGPALTKAFVKYFNFDESEAKYFENLVLIQKRNKSNPTVLFARKDLVRNDIKEYISAQESNSISETALSLLADPLTHILREMVTLPDFQMNAEWIQSRLLKKRPLTEIEIFIKSLLDARLIELTQEGYWTAPKLNLKWSTPTTTDRVKFHQEVMKISLESLVEVQESLRSFNVSYLNIKSENINLAKQLVRQFQIDFGKLLADDAADNVYQLSIQFQPVTELKNNH